MTTRATSLNRRWSLSAGSLLAIACVPRVPATLVITAPEAPQPDEQDAEPTAPKQPKHTGPDRSPPTIIRAEQVSETLLRLHFSESIAAPTGLEPNDFRLSSMNVYINSRGGYAYAAYYDFGYQVYGQPLRFVAVRHRSDTLDLEFTPALALHYCRQFQYDNSYNYAPPGVHADSGMFLHYAAGSIPIRDEAGNALASFGDNWARRGRSDPPESRLELSGDAAKSVGKNLIEIECGAQLPEGPR